MASFLTNVRDAMLEGMRSDLRTVRIDPRNPHLCRYLIASMGSLPEERLRVLFLDPARSLIADEEVQRGSLAQLAIYPRTIFRRALEHNAASIILVHNHPSGDPAPSAEDLSATRRLEEVGRALDVEILEHIIVTGTRTYNLIEGSAQVRPRGKFLPFFLRSHPDPADETDALAQRNAETAIRRRILRRQLLGNPELFGEPAWDMLVDLFIHQSRGQPLSMSSLCITAAIPTSSAMKLIQRLCDAGILERSPDAHDGRRSLVSLTPQVAHRLRAYFAEGAE
ncbi:JAB domain-containing protein [Sphingopyxis granuli]|uniref:JAB domain-containing protein n=1 Tax=Sphingopyxis granuli TaxID=267128 RepID=UPI001BB0B192|nr:JAB domain-containing protein [Sphingopyxis granuli]QUM70716.1 winged helix DNA-binding protein [Sphingopyxis granuli]